VLLTTIDPETEGDNDFLVVKIIPGNRYFRLEGNSYYFNRNMPLEAERREGRLHRVTCLFDVWWVTEKRDFTRPTCL